VQWLNGNGGDRFPYLSPPFNRYDPYFEEGTRAMVDLQQRIEQFHRDGYLIIPDVLSLDEVAILREGV